jgi:hypothetical protein
MKDWERYGKSHGLFQGSVLALDLYLRKTMKKLSQYETQVRNFTIWVTVPDE